MTKNQIDDYLPIAKRMFDDQQYANCAKYLNKHIIEFRNNLLTAQAYALQGDAYHLLGRDDLAVKSYQQALNLDPLEEKVYFHLARSYSELNLHDKEVESAHPLPKSIKFLS